MILDPVVSAISGDSHKNSETRRGLQPVVDFAQSLDCAVLGITHLAKNSGGRDDGGFEYTLRQAPVPGHVFAAQRADWGPPLDGSAHELMAVETPCDDGPSAVDEAETFLHEALKDGPMATKDVKAAAQAHGHNWRSVQRAKTALSVEAIKPGYQQPWLWQLPDAKTATHAKDHHLTDLWRPLEGIATNASGLPGRVAVGRR